jgi:expansin (peptidoglycan-binding protein)
VFERREERRALSVLSAIARRDPLPPIEVDQPLEYSLPYRVRRGFHRYYAAIAVGYRRMPVRVLPYLDIFKW